MKTNVKFREWNCLVKKAMYGNGATAIQLIDAEDFSPIATASVNLVEQSAELPDNQCYIKTWSENAGILEALVEAGVVKEIGKAVEVNQFGSKAVLVEILN